jgi:hypothetical protein
VAVYLILARSDFGVRIPLHSLYGAIARVVQSGALKC